MATRRTWLIAASGGAVLAAVLVVTLLSGRHGQDPAGADRVSTDGMPAFGTVAATVVGVRQGDAHTAIVEVDLPDGHPDCARDLRVEQVQDQLPDRPTTVYANVVYTAGTAVDATADGCPEHRRAEVPLRVTDPLGDRQLLFNSMGPAWSPDGARYRTCDEILGCQPPADHCDRAWIDNALYYMDLPVNRTGAVSNVVACDGTWLVLELNRGAGNCPPDQPCASTAETRRLFLYFGQYGWDTVASTRDAGCAAVHIERPDFPAALCESLPAVG
jgi:hypothetical protein